MDLSYDAVLYWADSGTSANTITYLNNYYANGKGVLLGSEACLITGRGVSLTKNITAFGSEIDGTITTQSSMNTILYNVGSITTSYICSPFTAINGASSIGSLGSGIGLVNYLDNTNKSFGRRVDINSYITASLNENTTTGMCRLII